MKIETLVPVAVLLCAALSAKADDITIGNFDFASPSTSSYIVASGAGTVPDWTFTDSESVGGVQSDSNAPAGQTAFFNSTSNSDGSSFPLNTAVYNGVNADSSTTALPAIAGSTDYTLTVAIGVPLAAGDDHATYTLSLLANGSPVSAATASIDASTLGTSGLPETAGYTSGSFYDFTVTLSAATIAADGLSGDSLGIQLGTQLDSSEGAYSETGHFSQTYFSDVRLTSEAVPEPATWAMLACGIGALVFAGRVRRFGVS